MNIYDEETQYFKLVIYVLVSGANNRKDSNESMLKEPYM